MSNDVLSFSYRYGERNIRFYPLDKDSADIIQGSVLTTAGATAGYLQRVDANSEAAVGVAVDPIDDFGTVDGDKSLRVDVSRDSVYEVNPSTGTVTVSLKQQKFDVAADGKTVLIGVTAANGDVECIDVDTARNTLLVRINPAFTTYTP